MNRGIVVRIALRYWKGSKTTNAAPILSRISMIAIATGAAAMFIMLSVFNGFDYLVKDLYKAFYPDLSITTLKGKHFSLSAAQLQRIQHLPGVIQTTKVLEDHVLAGDEQAFADGDHQQKVVTLKGIDVSYFDVNDIKDSIESLQPIHFLKEGQAILGWQIARILGVDYRNNFSGIRLYYLNPTVTQPELKPEEAFLSLPLHPVGTFQVDGEFDDKYVLAPLAQVQELFQLKGQMSSLELKLEPHREQDLKKQIQQLLGPEYAVRNRFEQNTTVYMMLSSEKWAMYFILTFVLIIASFNMIGALTMLVIEKNKDMGILIAMGAQQQQLSKIIVLEGILWALTGGIAGIVLGGILCFLQQQFGLIQLGSSFVVSTYPVKMLFTDVLIILGTVLGIGLFASIYPAIKGSRPKDISLKSN